MLEIIKTVGGFILLLIIFVLWIYFWELSLARSFKENFSISTTHPHYAKINQKQEDRQTYASSIK
jgi:hypothetical protein